MHKYFACMILSLFSLGFIVSCGKKSKPHLAKYGPFDATQPNTPTVLIADCIPGEIITCEGDFKYNTGAKFESSTGGYCEGNSSLVIIFALFECEDLVASSWSGSVMCKASQSKLDEVKPVSLGNIPC